ncbi:MAG: GTPase [Planctomycetota bacterium]
MEVQQTTPEDSRNVSGTLAASDLVAARLTATVAAGIATIAIRGGAAAEIVLTLAQLKPQVLRIGRVHFGRWPLPVLPETQLKKAKSTEEVGNAPVEQELFAEEVVVCRVSEFQVEVHCHGGLAVCNAILESLKEKGVRIGTAAEFGTRMVPSLESLAEEALIQASTDRSAAVLLAQLNGALREELTRIQHDLETGNEYRCISERLETLLKSARYGLRLSEGFTVVLAGPPNVGKSSLLNCIAGQEKSIVHADAGTTRDWVEVRTVLDGWPVLLSDTAGVRETDDVIESKGVQFAVEQISSADVVVAVVDISMGWTETHQQIIDLAKGPVVICYNKADLASAGDRGTPFVSADVNMREVQTSCKPSNSRTADHPAAGGQESGIGRLIEAIMCELDYPSDLAGPCVFHPQIQESLQQVRSLGTQGDLQQAIRILQELLC